MADQFWDETIEATFTQVTIGSAVLFSALPGLAIWKLCKRFT